MEAGNYLQFLLALIFVVGLIIVGAWTARRMGFGGPAVKRGQRRLAVVESLPVDARRRLLLVRRDDREHLLLLGGGADLLVERDIGRRHGKQDETT